MILAEIRVSPDELVFWRWGFVKLNATIVYSWLVILLLVLISWLATRKLSTGPKVSRWQNFLETIVQGMRNQIKEVMQQDPGIYLPFIGTLFLFIAVSNIISIVPMVYPERQVRLEETVQKVAPAEAAAAEKEITITVGTVESPTASLTTTVALALCVFFAVPAYGINRRGVGGYFRNYVEPTPLMLPFNIIGELSRTLALAVRLFGNMMSGGLIVAIVLSLAPLFVPIVLQLLGLLIGLIQAYIFAILASVYIASATRAHHQKQEETAQESSS